MQGASTPTAKPGATDVYALGRDAAESARLLILQADGLVELNRKYISLTSVGRLLMRTVAMAFDAYVNAAPGSAAPQPAVMSRVI